MESEDGSSQREIDLFDDLVHEGELEIIVRCDDAVQYFGMAQADLYIEAPNAPFAWNFAKAYIAIWLQMVDRGLPGRHVQHVPEHAGGHAGHHVRGAAGLLRAGSCRTCGRARPLAAVRSRRLIRLVNQDNLVKPLEFGAGEIGVQDRQVRRQCLPDDRPRVVRPSCPISRGLGRASEYVAYNFNFYDQLLARQCLTTFVYVTAIAIVGYFFMRTREIAA